MNEESSIGIGIVGSGFLAETRARCYAKAGAGGRIVAVASRTIEGARAWAEHHGVPAAFDDLAALLALDEVDVVDLCVPNLLHRPMAEAAARAGKHVVCTKPLAAYVGQDLAEDVEDAAVSARGRREMMEVAVADAQAMVDAADEAGVQLMYGENWVYAPSITRASDLLQAAGGALLEMRGWESHSGSHSPYSKVWRNTGGGALLRLAAHPIGAMLHLKREEGLERDGEPIVPVAVSAEVADLSRVPGVAAGGTDLATGWEDVENWGCVILSFSDGTRGVAYGSDNMLGGMESKLELLGSRCHLKCNLSPNDLLRAFTPDGGVFGDEYVMEKLDSGAGWTTPIPDEDYGSGHIAMCADFLRAVSEGRPALADGGLGLDVTRVVYAAYASAEEGSRIDL
ncbi:MAG: Gfo/Idh/MocA family oxidoreductase [Planctomycetota bacterium]|jgi:predicted dehydrogenase|nr:Gfo/Idh/MocA family oxidoreductase [Planctomycetota bacterium]MDP6988761.1 Gfo/Idh/MocA family oxidoreductase [Planctomycetota bacterium]